MLLNQKPFANGGQFWTIPPLYTFPWLALLGSGVGLSIIILYLSETKYIHFTIA